MGVDPPRGKASAASRRLSVGRLALASVLAVAAVLCALYYRAPFYPHITVVVKSPSGSPQPRAYVQVYALLPPGINKSLALVWNGTTDGQGRAYIPLGRLAPIARKWAEKGFGSSDVGLQIVATYGNATAFFTRFLFVTYKPKDVIEADNPLGWLYYSKTVEVKLKQVKIKAQRDGSRTASPYDVSAPQPPPPPASVCGGLMPIWMEVWEYQTPTTYIPIIWLYDKMGYNAGGYIEGIASSSTTMSFAASVALTPDTQLGSSSISNAEFEFAGTSFSDTTFAFNNAPWGYMGFENPTSVALNVRGTLGTAEFQVYCYDPITGYTAPVDYYAVEVYIQSADLSRIYRSTAVGMTPVENMLNILSQYGYIGYYPFDHYRVGPGNPYIYSFISIQQNSNWGFSWEIPAGALLIYVLEGIGITLPWLPFATPAFPGGARGARPSRVGQPRRAGARPCPGVRARWLLQSAGSPRPVGSCEKNVTRLKV
ncbi:hypothetical protein Pisl_1413 [Pyrobaculum islandicum DSM 4184]|uniref:Uncharacterized protein n=1 Tax=Pyrobaculum islandicum (strain DSM 4184 / JCM 9189 / GEO3) TaxID=384616 RepID=A1RUD9_PYRIL|nr:hypothetical protein [Pyrobaculum islandicum]ABL88571.1 hypothetical protein Pisl_1413 [Pyrobaculum islandicum DSM 4184]